MRPMRRIRRLQYLDAFARRRPPVLHRCVPQLRAGRPDVGGLDRRRPDRRGLPRSASSTVATAAGWRRAASLQAERELQVAPRAIAMLSSAYMHSPDARRSGRPVGGGRRRHAPPAGAGPGQDVRVTEPFTDHPAIDLARLDAGQAPAKLLWALDRPAQLPGTVPPHGRGPRFPGTIPRDLERARPERRLHRPWRRAGTCATSWPAAAGGGGRPGPVRAGRGRQDPGRAGVRPPFHGRLRPGLVDAGRAGRGDQRSRWRTWPAGWACGSATTWPRPPRLPSRSCAGTPRRTGCSSSTTPTTRGSSSRTCPRGRAHPHHLAQPGLEPFRRAARGGRLHPG